jgi:putative FmdB family regulatory protein
MPVYDYRCNACGRSVALFYKSYSAYDRAVKTCPHCGSTDLTRIIKGVTIPKQGRDYARMTSGDMLNVLEGGNSDEVNRMMRDVGVNDNTVDKTLGAANTFTPPEKP